MAQSSRIKTPLRQHLYRFRIGALSVLSFMACVALTLWLWQRQATVGSILGEIETRIVTVTAGADGRLSEAENHVFWQRGDTVQKDDTVAQLDPRELMAQIATVKAEADKLALNVEAARAEFDLDVINLKQDHTRELVNLRLEKARKQIELFRQAATVSELQIQAEGLKERALLLTRVTSTSSLTGASGTADAMQQVNEAKRVSTLLEREKDVYNRIMQQYQEAVDDLEAYPGEIGIPALDAILKPIEAEQVVQQRRIDEIQALMDSLIMKSPIEGEVTHVHRLPGEHVRAGDDLITIAVPSSQYIVSYVRDSHRLPIFKGMKVGLRLRGDPSATEYVSQVEQIGPVVEQVPPHQTTSQDTPEWGVPIRIPIPAALLHQQRVRPGQLIHVNFNDS